MSKSYRILSLDGGGMRGIITAVWLDALEQRLGGALREHFDLVAGTSTGSILAAAVVMGMPAKEVIRMYESEGRSIFAGRALRWWGRLGRVLQQGVSAPKHSDIGLGKTLQKHFGQVRFEDLPRRPMLMISSYETQSRQALFFKSDKPEHQSIQLWEAVKCSCSAPAYFPAHVLQLDGDEMSMIDGGVVANNPAACAIAEGVRRNGPRDVAEPCKLENFVMISMGTGQGAKPISLSNAREWGPAEWALPIIDVLFDGAADAVDYVASYLIPPERYIRFQTRLHVGGGMDDASMQNLRLLKDAAGAYLNSDEGRNRLDAAVKALQTPHQPPQTWRESAATRHPSATFR